jgi:TonB C terminal
MQNRRLRIDEWNQPPAAIRAPVAVSTRRWSLDVRAVGLLGTLVLHTLVFQSFLSGRRAPKIKPPDTQGLGATLLKSEVAPAETLILIELPDASMSDKALAEELASLGPKPNQAVVTVLSPDPLPHLDIPQDQQADEQTAVSALDSGDPAARAALFGRYTVQIDARIERAWRRPRSPVTPASDPELFKCQVRIIQDAHGSVQEVQILSCNGSAAWQHSLVTAILASSPLPAPPDPNVFTRALTMTFSAGPYTTNSVADDYEPDQRAAARVATNE